MASVLTSAIIVNAKSSVSTYVSEANALYGELQQLITNLTGSNFMGDAAEGFKEFFNTKATPALVANLTEPGSSVTAGLDSMLDSIKEQLLDTVDPQLGDINRDPSAG